MTTLHTLADHGPDSMEELAKMLDPSEGVASVTTDVLDCSNRDNVLGIGVPSARALAGFPHRLYQADIHVHGVNYRSGNTSSLEPCLNRPQQQAV